MRRRVSPVVFVFVLATALAAGCGNDVSLGPDGQPSASTDPTPSSDWAELNPVAGTPRSLPAQLFPRDNWWNLNISKAPVDPRSATYGAALASARLSYDWGNNYGIPYTSR